ncbi:MAG: potassium transporter KtrB [Clostridia bacterium]|nr:potassium transporter KtrB [Clostridia bacterium]
MHKKHFGFSTTGFIMLGFVVAILAGSILLSLPISSSDGNGVSYIDALFTATTSVCVTGLVVVPTVSAWSVFGQVIILLLIQIGGLGVITVLSALMIFVGRKMGLSDRLLIQDAFNLNTLSGLVRFVKKVIAGTFLVEAIGALLYMTVFVPQFGLRGIWMSVFNSVSAFCNAGMDIVSGSSMCDYSGNFVINAVTCALIILGGMGYIVWWDVIWNVRRKKGFRYLSLHSKISLCTTLVLLIFGTFVFFVCEYNNPETMGGFSIPHKLMASFFQSVTTRTAGFASIAQENLTNASTLASLFLMFVGGSPVGTAGGIKTVTVAVLCAAAISSVKMRSDVTLFGRSITAYTIKKAVSVFVVSFTIMFASTVLLSLVTDAELSAVLYETVSATATVGLSKNLTPSLNVWGKLIIIVTMYFGRVGPISLAIALNRKNRSENIIKNPPEEISVG